MQGSPLYGTDRQTRRLINHAIYVPIGRIYATLEMQPKRLSRVAVGHEWGMGGEESSCGRPQKKMLNLLLNLCVFWCILSGSDRPFEFLNKKVTKKKTLKKNIMPVEIH